MLTNILVASELAHSCWHCNDAWLCAQLKNLRLGSTAAQGSGVPAKQPLCWVSLQYYPQWFVSSCFFLWRYTCFPLQELRELPRIPSVLFHNLLFSHYFLKFQQFLLGTSCNKLIYFCMGLQSTISLSEKKRSQNLFQKQNVILLSLWDFNHSSTITRTTSCEAGNIRKLRSYG